MNNTKSKFEVLVSKMEMLNETEKGKLKGGFTTLLSVSESNEGTNVICPKNFICIKKPKDPEVPKEETIG
ncbi:hypothetical protein ACFFUE_10825 [Bergeyella porcorum]|uniref:hypothetical protein n=1 Tax=Bergeyella porcorum TaxID=1735111 RepID=UPI0035EA7611